MVRRLFFPKSEAKVAPPFAMKAEDGTWRGISIDLWRRIADQMHLRYRFQETTLKGLTDGVAEGSLDAAVAALTVTSPRQRIVDFTQPLLLWLVNEVLSGSLRVLDGTFDPQTYAIALPQGSKLRIPIDLPLLDATRSDWWRETLFAYLGPS